jgi:molecular chaperone GrpE
MNKPEKQEETDVRPAPETVDTAEPEKEEAAETTDTAAEVDSELPDLQVALAEAEKDLAQHRDAMLRMQAEMENLRKRLVRDLERSRKFALERIMADLLPVWDSLERGLETDGNTATVESMKEGKALIKKMLGKVMQDHGLTLIDPLGEQFNPEFHEAMTMLPSAEYGENMVMEVLQKGFQLNDRLLRPAMVVVSKGSDTD